MREIADLQSIARETPMTVRDFFIFAAGDFSTTLEMTGLLPFRLVGGGARASRPTETGNGIPNEYLLAALYLRADEERPTTLYQSLLPLFNVISTEAIAEWRNPPRKSPDYLTNTTVFDLFTRCGCDTAARR